MKRKKGISNEPNVSFLIRSKRPAISRRRNMAKETVRNRRVAEIRMAVREIRKRNRREVVSDAIGVPGHRRRKMSSSVIARPFW